jgi:[acyl-carrier-protein] S-malonyltransferase
MLNLGLLFNNMLSIGDVQRLVRRGALRRPAANGDGEAPAAPERAERPLRAEDVAKRIGTAALAFRGYDVANLGRSPELLDHPVYGTVVRETLDEAAEACSEAIGARVDLAARVRNREETTLDTFPQDVATIVAMEVAQFRLLEEVFEVPVRQARMSFGYSLGELSALILGGVFSMRQVLSIPLMLARDCAELAADTKMGVLFTRGPALPMHEVERLCVRISSEGRGLIGPSAYLSPNTALLLGQGDTLDRLEQAMGDFLPVKVSLRRNSNRWPPLHTPLVWQRNIPNRAAMALYRLEGGLKAPSPPVFSCITGEASYDDVNCRDLLVRWTDHPQRLWDVICESLAAGVDLYIHVGPDPKMIPATFSRLSNNVSKHVGSRALSRLGHGMIDGWSRNAWLARLLPSQTALLRAPFVAHMILEDWLLDQPVP